MLVGFIKEIRQFWRNYGWHCLLVLLLLTFVILFIINQFNRDPQISSITFSDIYEYFISMMLRPIHTPQQQQRRRSRSSSGGSSGGSSRGEMSCREFVEFYFQKPFIKVRPDFLKNPVTGENLELDIFNEELMLAIEYNGAQHYQYNSFMHKNSRDRFQNQQYRDLIKKDLCQKQGITLIIVPYTISEDDISSFLFEEFKKLHLECHPSIIH
jgi:hypothetical protein